MDKSILSFQTITPTAQPLHYNQEGEGCIRHIENVENLATNATFILIVLAFCIGTADPIVSSPVFNDIRKWVTYKSLLRRKFRSSCSSTTFFTNLKDFRMTTTQGPQNLFHQLERIVISVG